MKLFEYLRHGTSKVQRPVAADGDKAEEGAEVEEEAEVEKGTGG